MTFAQIPPGPKGNFLFGNFIAYSRDPLGFLTECAKKFGDVVALRMPATQIYLLSNPQHIEQVLTSTNVKFTTHGGMKIPLSRKLFGRGILTTDGAEWRRQRRLTFPFFSHSSVSKYGETMADETRRTLSGWKKGQTRDVYQDMIELTLGISIKTLFGAERLSPQVSELAKSLLTLKEAFLITTLRQSLDRLCPLPLKSRFRKAVEKIDVITDEIIRQRRLKKSDSDDLFSVLMSAQDEDGNAITDERLRGELKTFLITAHESPGTVLAWAFYLLARHPETEAKLLSEIEEVLGDRPPETADVKRLNYASSVLKETMRLYPPGWFIAREAVADCEIGDYFVPKGTQVLMSQWLMHRDSRFWEEPTEFKPERWLGNVEKQRPKYAYFPYGGGPRFCMGPAFSEMFMVLALAMTMQKFRFEIAPNQTIEPMPSAILLPKNGIKLTPFERNALKPVLCNVNFDN